MGSHREKMEKPAPDASLKRLWTASKARVPDDYLKELDDELGRLAVTCMGAAG